MHRLEQMKETLMNCVQTQINGHLDQADSKELGEAVDMIKDLSEAIYYCTITKAMKESEKEDKNQQRMMYYPVYMMDGGERNGGSRYYDERDRINGRKYYGDGMYYNDGAANEIFRPLSDSDRGALNNYPSGMIKDPREGRSPYRRMMYMEGKEMHHDKSKQMKELEEYMQELTQDIVEMIEGASPEEKQILQQKLNTLSAKVK